MTVTINTKSDGAEPRLTPYERVFGAGAFEKEQFPAIAAEVEQAGVDIGDADAFRRLRSVVDVVGALAPLAVSGRDTVPGGESSDIRREHARINTGLLEYGPFIYQAFRFWSADRPLFVLTEPAARAVAAPGDQVGEWTLCTPSVAGYVQFPEHLFWSDAGTGSPEAVDGFHWVYAGPHEPLRLALVLGARADRPGITLVDIQAPLPPEPARHWADTQGREVGEDFANVLPGGELSGLLSIQTRGELLKLASLLFHRIDRDPSFTGPPVSTDEPGHTMLSYRILGYRSDAEGDAQ